MNESKVVDFISKFWDQNVIPALSEYIKIPCKSLDYDTNWQNNGYLDSAVKLVANWIKTQNIPNVKIETLSLKNYPPFLFVDVPGSSEKHSQETIVFYGHLDKMPESEGWREGLGPWQPVLKGNSLFGRGTVDDGYAAFLPFAAIKALREQNISYPRCVLILETSEESGSIGFEDYLAHIKNKIGDPKYIFVLDSGGEDADHLWCTTSLRGILDSKLKVEVLDRNVHSGTATGIAPSSFRILRELLSRIEDQKTGKILLSEFYVDIPQKRIEEAKALAKVKGDAFYKALPFIEGVRPTTEKIEELILNVFWRPGMEILGAMGLPTIDNASHAIRPYTEVKISIRVPPCCDIENAIAKLQQVLKTDIPYNAKVTFSSEKGVAGWNAPEMEGSFADLINSVSKKYFGSEVLYTGCGGGIGIVAILSNVFPEAKFLVMGAEVPDCGAHGPNEYLNIDTAKKLTACVAEMLMRKSL